MLTPLRWLVVAVVLVSGLAWTSPTHAEVLADQGAATSVTAHELRSMWSELDTDGVYRLVTSVDGASAVWLPVPGRSVPFDVSLGESQGGQEVAVYSRCRREPGSSDRSTQTYLPEYSFGIGCDVFRCDFTTGTERRVPGASKAHASEFLPSVSRGRLAFARVDERRRFSRRAAHSLRVIELAGGRPIRSFVPGRHFPWMGIAGLALRDRRLAWVYDGGVSHCRSERPSISDQMVASQLWTAKLNGSPVRLGRGCAVDPVAMFHSPSVRPGQVSAVAAGPGYVRDSQRRLLTWSTAEPRSRPVSLRLPSCLSSAIVDAGWLYTSRLVECPDPTGPAPSFEVARIPAPAEASAWNPLATGS